MRKQSNCIDKRLENWINKRLLIIIKSYNFEIENILYIYKDEKKRNI